MRGRFMEKTEEDKKAWSERVKEMLTWKECDGCKKRKEALLRLVGIKPGKQHE